MTVTERYDVFLSYSRNDPQAADSLRRQFEAAGLSVFKDDQRIPVGEVWLDKLQRAVEGCGTFVVLIGQDGVRRWMGAETQVALCRYFGPQDDSERLPIYPILLPAATLDTLPALLRLFQQTSWDGAKALPNSLHEQIRARIIGTSEAATFEGCPFIGLAAYSFNQAHLFFGRQRETLEALACFDTRPGSPTVRWLEISGNSGSGKSSLMNAGLLPLVEQGWLWPRTGLENWIRIGPMMPGESPVVMLAEQLARTFTWEMRDVRERLEHDERGLTEWLRGRKEESTAFLLAVDQFEELFTFADADERARFDHLLACAMADPDCPLFVISTIRSDFLERFAEDLPRLVGVRNRVSRTWTLGPISANGLREVITGPARLAGLSVDEVTEVIVADAADEAGALPLVENALHYLWKQRQNDRLSGRLFNDSGRLAGILSRTADGLLNALDKQQRDRALEVLFQLVQVDPESRRHTRRRMALNDAVALAGGRDRGRKLIYRLAGQRPRDIGTAKGPLRLITVSEESGWVNLIHETLIRSKGLDPKGKPQPYWPTLWDHIERNKKRAASRERLKLQAREWATRRGLSRLFGLAGWSSLAGSRGLATPGSIEHRYLGWSRGRALVEVGAIAALLAGAGVLSDLVNRSAYPPTLVVRALLVERGIWSVPRPAMEVIQAGRFDMGDLSRTGHEDERPVHPVLFAKPFALGKYEVTFEEYDLFAAATGRDKPNDEGWGRDNRPVVNVSWIDATDYVEWLSARTGSIYRLPSEAEWEYAARATTRTSWYWEANAEHANKIACDYASVFDEGFKAQLVARHYRAAWEPFDCDDGFPFTAPVGSFNPNKWNLHDMIGNVWELTLDCYRDSYAGAPNDGSPWNNTESTVCAKRVVRGGSWFNSPEHVRATNRDALAPNHRDRYVGFRLAGDSSTPSGAR